MKEHIGISDIVMITLDTLRYDVAVKALGAGETPGFASLIGAEGWEKRHTPSSFTYAAHQAFFAGFLPTPVGPGPHPRRFASEFSGSTSVGESTFCFPEATLPEALSRVGYHTVCIGGTGFFSRQNALSCVLPDLFAESHWRKELGVSHPQSEQHQVEQAVTALNRDEKVFLFLNVSALHQPNWFYLHSESAPDSLETHRAALRAVDSALQPLWEALRARGSAFVMLFSDHGTAYGEDGYFGHRLGHEAVWTVPYAEFSLP